MHINLYKNVIMSHKETFKVLLLVEVGNNLGIISCIYSLDNLSDDLNKMNTTMRFF